MGSNTLANVPSVNLLSSLSYLVEPSNYHADRALFCTSKRFAQEEKQFVRQHPQRGRIAGTILARARGDFDQVPPYLQGILNAVQPSLHSLEMPNVFLHAFETVSETVTKTTWLFGLSYSSTVVSTKRLLRSDLNPSLPPEQTHVNVSRRFWFFPCQQTTHDKSRYVHLLPSLLERFSSVRKIDLGESFLATDDSKTLAKHKVTDVKINWTPLFFNRQLPDFHGFISNLASNSSLKRLDLTLSYLGTALDTAKVAAIATIKGLEALTLSVGDEGFESHALAPLRNLPDLKELTLNGKVSVLTPSPKKPHLFATLEKLEKLSVDTIVFTRDGRNGKDIDVPSDVFVKSCKRLCSFTVKKHFIRYLPSQRVPLLQVPDTFNRSLHTLMVLSDPLSHKVLEELSTLQSLHTVGLCFPYQDTSTELSAPFLEKLQNVRTLFLRYHSSYPFYRYDYPEESEISHLLSAVKKLSKLREFTLEVHTHKWHLETRKELITTELQDKQFEKMRVTVKYTTHG